MGQHSGQDVFKGITKLGIFNPRLNTVYLLDMFKVEYSRAAEPPVQCGVSHLSRRTEPHCL